MAKDYSSQYWDAANALAKLGIEMHEGGHLKYRPTIESRREEHRRLKASGLSIREIVDKTGASLGTVERDVSQSGTEKRKKGQRNQRGVYQSGTPKPDTMESDLDEDPENFRTAFFLRVDTAVQCAVYSGPLLSPDMIKAARRVAKAWDDLAQAMEDKYESNYSVCA